MSEGYLTFTTPMFGQDLNVEGKQTTICFLEGAEFPGFASGVKIDLLGGGSLHQVSPPSIHAPLTINSQPVSVEVSVEDADDYWTIRRMVAIAKNEPISILIEDPQEDIWLIPEDDKRVWTMSRWTAYNVFAIGTHPTRVSILENAAWGTDTEQTLGSDPPGAGEYYFDQTVSVDSLKTPDISAHSGKYLVCRSYFWRQFVVEDISRGVPQRNGMRFSMDLDEFVEAKTWSEV